MGLRAIEPAAPVPRDGVDAGLTVKLQRQKWKRSPHHDLLPGSGSLKEMGTDGHLPHSDGSSIRLYSHLISLYLRLLALVALLIMLMLPFSL